MNTCGTCTLCCKVMGVDELHKPRNVWCQHARAGKGCAIYEARPESCRAFDCLWLQSQSRPAARMAPELRPDRCKVVLSATKDGRPQANVDPGYPNAWREGAIGRLLARMSRHFGLIVAIGDRRILVKNAAGLDVTDYEATQPTKERTP